jgi:hypothetical protein
MINKISKRNKMSMRNKMGCVKMGLVDRVCGGPGSGISVSFVTIGSA